MQLPETTPDELQHIFSHVLKTSLECMASLQRLYAEGVMLRHKSLPAEKSCHMTVTVQFH